MRLSEDVKELQSWRMTFCLGWELKSLTEGKSKVNGLVP